MVVDARYMHTVHGQDYEIQVKYKLLKVLPCFTMFGSDSIYMYTNLHFNLCKREKRLEMYTDTVHVPLKMTYQYIEFYTMFHAGEVFIFFICAIHSNIFVIPNIILKTKS